MRRRATTIRAVGVYKILLPAEATLVVVALDVAVLGEALLWEATADGAPYPHVHAPLPLDAVAAVHHITGGVDVDAELGPVE